MKKIEAVFVPQKFDQVMAAMTALDLTQFLVSKLTAHEPEQALKPHWSGQWHEDFSSRLKLEVIVCDEVARDVASEILHAARTRHAGDSSVTMSTVETVVEIDYARSEHLPIRQVAALHT